MGCANELAIDKIESENRVNNFLVFIFNIFLIPEVIDVLMSGCFRYTDNNLSSSSKAVFLYLFLLSGSH